MAKKIEVTFFEDIAEEVKRIDVAMQELNASKLTREAIVTLLRHSTGETKRTIENVLWGLENINRYIKETKK